MGKDLDLELLKDLDSSSVIPWDIDALSAPPDWERQFWKGYGCRKH